MNEPCPCGCGLLASETNPRRLFTVTLTELMSLDSEDFDELESLTPENKKLWWELRRFDRRSQLEDLDHDQKGDLSP